LTYWKKVIEREDNSRGLVVSFRLLVVGRKTNQLTTNYEPTKLKKAF